ncbi:hypothetical protein PO124_10460 [Bacillus licheniformis]|nr:hypothetical protein [Bacillus licheniformis]
MEYIKVHLYDQSDHERTGNGRLRLHVFGDLLDKSLGGKHYEAVFLSFGLTGVLTVAAILWFSRVLAKPIIKLKEATESIKTVKLRFRLISKE